MRVLSHSLPRRLVWLFAATTILARAETFPIGAIDFYAYAGLNLREERARVPLHEAENLSEDQMESMIAAIKRAVPASSVQVVCCGDRHDLLIYIGLDGQSSRDVPYRAAPAGKARLPQGVVELESQFGEALSKAIENGVSDEDQSKGYALSQDSALRASQIAIHDYAMSH